MSNPLFTSKAMRVAIDAVFSTIGDTRTDGTNTKATPPDAVIFQGVRPYKQVPAQFRNWLDNQFGQILAAIIGAAGSVKTQTFITSGTWTAPMGTIAGTTFAVLLGYGGAAGGAGGSGGGDATYSNILLPGGGAGGGALFSVQIVPVVPTTVYPVSIGAGGAGGAGGAPQTVGSAPAAGDGSDGGDTTFGTLATFRGGSKGLALDPTQFGSTSPLKYAWGAGGPPVRLASVTRPKADGSADLYRLHAASEGGFGTVNAGIAQAGMPSPQGYAGGAGAVGGADSGAHLGGGPGGGGGGGPGGAGADGGDGGAGASSGAGGPGLPADDAPPNTGAGGGGGGAGGSGPAAGGVGGPGGAGGSGRLTVVWFELLS